MGILHEHTPACKPPAAQDLPPFLADTPRGSPERAQWWAAYRAATRDDALADGILGDGAAPAAPLNGWDLARERWGRLVLDHRAILRGQPSGRLPEIDVAHAAELATLLVWPEGRQLLRELLLDLLADDMVDIAITVAQGVQDGE